MEEKNIDDIDISRLIKESQLAFKSHRQKIVTKTPFCIALYNLHLGEELSKKEVLQQTIDFYYDLLPLEDEYVPTTTDIDFETEYHDFHSEYTAMRRFIDEWIENKISADSIKWVNKHLKHIVNEIGVKIHELEEIFSINAVCLDESFIKKAYPENAETMIKGLSQLRFTHTQIGFRQKPRLGLSNIEDIFFQVVVDLQRIIESKQELRRCKALKTQRTPKCQNIFIPQKKDHIFCSERCRNRANRRKYYRKHGK